MRVMKKPQQKPYSSKSPVKEAKPLCVYIIDESEWNWKPSIWYSTTHLFKHHCVSNTNLSTQRGRSGQKLL